MPIDEVMTIKEACERWHVGNTTLRQSCTGYKGGKPRFLPGEFRQSGSTWLITISGMTRLYGPEPE